MFKDKNFFKKTFLIPSIIWILISLLAMYLDEISTDPMTWSELFLADATIIFFWFIISCIMYFIHKRIHKKNNKIDNINTLNLSVSIKDNNNEKVLHSCKTNVTIDEYKKLIKYYPELYRGHILKISIINIIFIVFINIIFNKFLAFIFFIIIIIFMIAYCKIRFKYLIKKDYDKYCKIKQNDTKVTIYFYEDYFYTEGDKSNYKFYYNEIINAIETNTNFYLKTEKTYTIIEKNECSLELINFIRRKLKNLENYLGDNSNFKKLKIYRTYKFKKYAMNFLFILTILSLFASFDTWDYVNNINNTHGFGYNKYAWVVLIWLPIPIISIILGFKYNKAGYKCKKNIIAGFIIGALLLAYSSFSFMPTYLEDYTKIYDYNSIINAKLPENGQLEIYHFETYFDIEKTNFTLISVYYDNEDTNELLKSIEDNETWILSTEIKSTLKAFIPTTMTSNSNAYFSIYNKTTNEYNSLPKNAGIYEIYAMKYDIFEKKLEINKFDYSFK